MIDPLDSFDQWYSKAYPRVYAAIFAFCGQEPTAQDAADEAFVRALERWGRVSQMSSPIGWTVVVGINRVKRVHLRRTLERRALLRAEAEDSEGSASTADLRVDLWRLVARLSTRQRETIALRYVADLQINEIASRLGVAPGTVTATLAQARARLRRELEIQRADGRVVG